MIALPPMHFRLFPITDKFTLLNVSIITFDGLWSTFVTGSIKLKSFDKLTPARLMLSLPEALAGIFNIFAVPSVCGVGELSMIVI